MIALKTELPRGPDETGSRARVRFRPEGAAFFAALKDKVDRYFDEGGHDRSANGAMVAKSVFWLGVTASLYALLLADVLPPLVALGIALLVGFCLACIGFNVGHDAIHGAYAERRWVNGLLGWTFQMLGASAYTWSVAHNVVHHTYTNIPGHDDDLEPGPLLRFHTARAARALHRWQHLYAWVLYCFVSLVWLLQKDFVQMLTMDRRTGKRPPTRAWLSVLSAKLLHLAIFVALPLWLVDAALWQLALTYLLMHFVAGFTLAIVFQLAHVVEGPSMPSASPAGEPRSWAEHQLLTTANFSRGGGLATFVCGGLNHQIEHHLFPRVCHIHYAALAPLVEETAREHGLPYHEHPSFLAAVRSHARLLKHLGSAPAR